MAPRWEGLAAGALALAALDLLLPALTQTSPGVYENPTLAGNLQAATTGIPGALGRLIDPTVPLIGAASSTSGSASSAAGSTTTAAGNPAAVKIPSASSIPVGGGRYLTP